MTGSGDGRTDNDKAKSSQLKFTNSKYSFVPRENSPTTISNFSISRKELSQKHDGDTKLWYTINKCKLYSVYKAKPQLICMSYPV